MVAAFILNFNLHTMLVDLIHVHLGVLHQITRACGLYLFTCYNSFQLFVY